MKKKRTDERPNLLVHFFTHNFGLKIVSLVFALILWTYVVNETNPSRTKRVVNIPVTVEGLAELNNNGLTTKEDMTQNAPAVSVQVSVPLSDYAKVTADTITASVDVSKAASAGTYSMAVKISFAYGDISLLSVSPASIDIAVDQLVTADIPVHIENTGVLPDGLIILNESPVSFVTVSGPGSYVSRIARGIISCDLGAQRDSYTFKAVCRFVDEANNTVRLKDEYSVLVDMNVQSVRSLSPDTTSCITGESKLASRYEFKGLEIDAGSVKVYGPASLLDDMNGISFESINISSYAAGETAVQLIPVLPEGVHLYGGASSVAGTVTIAEKQSSVTYTKSISVTGAGNRTVSISNGSHSETITADKVLKNLTVSVTLTGPVSVIDKLKATDISVVLDLSGTESGTHTLTPAIIRGANAPDTVQASAVTGLTVTIS